MIDREKHLKAIIAGKQPYEDMGAFDGKHALYCAKDASPLVEFWRAEDYAKAAIDTDSEEGEKRQAERGKKKLCKLGGAKEGGLLVGLCARTCRIVPSFDFRLWAGMFPAKWGVRELDIWRGYEVVLWLRGAATHTFKENLRAGQTVTDRLAKLSQRAQASLYPIEMILNYTGIESGETFSAFLTRSLKFLAKQRKSLEKEKAEVAAKGKAEDRGYIASLDAGLAEVDGITCDLGEIAESEDLLALWEGIFKEYAPEEVSDIVLATDNYILSPSGQVITNFERAEFNYNLARTKQEKEQGEAYKKGLEEIAPKLSEARAKRTAKEAEKKGIEARIESLDPFSDAGDLERQAEAKEKEIENAKQEEADLAKQLRELSRNLIIWEDGSIYANKAPYCPPATLNEEGRIEMLFETDLASLSVSVSPTTALQQSNTSRIKADLVNLLKVRIAEKCRAGNGTDKIFFSWEEVYQMTGGVVDEQGKENACDMFIRAVKVLMDTRIDFKTKTRARRGVGFAFVSGYEYDEEKEGVTLRIYKDFAEEIGSSNLYITESKAAKSLPSPTDQNAYIWLRQREIQKQGYPLWTYKELLKAMGIIFNEKNPKRNKETLSNRIASFKKAGLIVEYAKEGERYRLITIDGARDNEEREKTNKAKRLMKATGLTALQARQRLERCSWDYKAALDSVHASEASKALRNAKAKEKQEGEAEAPKA